METSPATWVQLLQALVAREMVEGLGMSSARVAETLGLAPSAVSQYLSGKRLRRGFLEYSTKETARRVARQTADRLLKAPASGSARNRILLQGASHLADQSDPATAGEGVHAAWDTSGAGEVPSRALTRWLRRRVRVEQEAVTQCMHLAQRARDELTRAIFRQIASDSLRHAEIVASLGPYLDRGISATFASGVTPEEVEALIEGERRAEGGTDNALLGNLQGTMSLLMGSMEADERKHTELLRGLLASGFPTAAVRRRTKLSRKPRKAPVDGKV